jgi:hypothetical protein
MEQLENGYRWVGKVNEIGYVASHAVDARRKSRHGGEYFSLFRN